MLHYIGRAIRIACGWFAAYLAVGGAASFAVTRAYTSASTCWPFLTVGGNIETKCSNAIVDALWTISLGIPRLVIIFPALGISFLKAWIKNGFDDFSYLANGIWWLLLTLPLILVIWIGLIYWSKRKQLVAFIIAILLIIEVGILGWTT